jgi:large repetitive protein
MTAPRGFTEPPPLVEITGELRTAAGSGGELHLQIVNQAGEPRVFAVTAVGVDPAWLPMPARSEPVGPGERLDADLTVRPTEGSVPARYPFAVAVQALDPHTAQATSRPTVTEVVLLVNAPTPVDVSVEPAQASAVFGKSITVVVRNTAATDESVVLEVQAPSSARIRLRADGPIRVPAGQSVPVRGRAKVSRPSIVGRRSRHNYTVTAHTSGAPREASAAFTSRPMLGPVGVKLGAALAVIALWAAAAVIFIPQLADSVRSPSAKGTPSPTGSAPGSGGSSGTGTGGGGSGGSGGSGGGGSGGGSGSGSGAAAAAAAPALQPNGSVAGSSPGGVTVALAPTTFDSAEAQGAQHIPADAAHQPIGKLLGAVVPPSPPSAVAADRSVRTGTDGAWSFPKVKPGGFYLLTFSKPGYQTQRFIIDGTAAAAATPMKVTLLPGQGHLSGTIFGRSGGVTRPVGGTRITISDGTNSITTSSNSKGAVGQWSVDGLSTPSSYLVSAGRDGLGTESALVNLSAGGSTSVNLTLRPGAATLHGQVDYRAAANDVRGVGNAEVTASDGTLTRTATTVTSGLRTGTYVLPDLPPGRYAVSVRADGFLAQSRSVTIQRGAASATLDAMMNPATAVVAGSVALPGAPGPHGPIGVLLTNATATYKNTTDNNGAFSFTGVAPGVYTLSAEYFGMVTTYRTVKVVLGKPIPSIDLSLLPATTNQTSTITGFVGSAIASSGTLGCTEHPPESCLVSFTLVDSDGKPVATRLKDSADFAATSEQAPASEGPTPYTLSAENGLAAGLYKLTIGATEFLPATIQIRVPHNNVATAPQLSLYPGNTIAGTIDAKGNLQDDTVGKADYVNCVWAVPKLAGEAPPTDCADAGPQTTCTRLGLPTTNSAVLDSNNAYQIKGLCDGVYDVYVVIQNPLYVKSIPVAVETVRQGQTADYSPHVPRKGRVLVSFRQVDDATGAVTAKTGTFPVGISCSNGDAATGLSSGSTETSGILTVLGVDAGRVTCTASTLSPALTGTVGGIVASNDNDTSAVITLSQGLGALVARVVSPYSTGAHPLGTTAVTVKGTINYQGDQPETGSAAPTTNDEGCFALVPPKTTLDPALVPPACGSLSASGPAPNVVELGLANRNVAVDVAATPTTDEYSANVLLSGTGTALNTISVAPKPAGADGLTIVPDPTGIDLGNATITVDKTGAQGAGTVTVTVGANNALIWRDSKLPAGGLAWPGTYQLTATLPGFLSQPVQVDCAAWTATGSDPADRPSCVARSPLTLRALGTLGGKVFGTDAGTNQTSVLNGATVTATCVQGADDARPCVTTADNPSEQYIVRADSAGSYSILATGATRYLLTPGIWTLTVSASGYATKTVTDLEVRPGDNDGVDVTLDALGTLTGTVSAVNDAETPQILGRVANATITLRCDGTETGQACPASDPAPVITNTSGLYSFFGTGGTYSLALGKWSLSVHATGYIDQTFAIDIGSGSNVADEQVRAFAAVSGTVIGLDGAGSSTGSIAGALISPHCLSADYGLTCPADPKTLVSDVSGRYVITGSPVPYVLVPGLWQFTVSATGYDADARTTVHLVPGDNTDVTLTATALGGLTGNVSDTNSGDPVASAKVRLVRCAGDKPTDGTDPDDINSCQPQTGDLGIGTNTNGQGGYSIAGSSNAFSLVPDHYLLTVKATGYVTYTQVMTISAGPNVGDVTVSPLGSMSGTVRGRTDPSSTGAVLSGAKVVIAYCGPVTTSTCGAAGAETHSAVTDRNGFYSFASPAAVPYILPLGLWTLKVTAGGFSDDTSTVTVVSGANDGQDVTLDALGAIAGTVSGQLSKTADARFTQTLRGATVTAVYCGPDGSDGTNGVPENCAAPSDFVQPSPAHTDANGLYSITGSGSGANNLIAGLWKVSVTAFGYQPATQYLTVASGSTGYSPTLDVRLVDVPIGIQDNNGSFTTHVSLAVKRVDNPAEVVAAPTVTSDNKLLFSNLVPASYQITITGDGTAAGRSVIPTVVVVTVPLSDSADGTEIDIPISTLKNTISGIVQGPTGASGTKALAGITVELGTPGGTDGFTAAQDASDHDLVTTTGTTGAFTFTGVPNGNNYIARVNNAPTEPNGYRPLITSTPVSAQFEIPATMGTLLLDRVTQKVKVTLAVDDGDNIGTAATLVSSDDPPATLQLTGTATSTEITYALPEVPAGCWKLVPTLAAGHPGTVSLDAGGGSDCTTADGYFPVSGAQSTVDASAAYTLHEHALSLTVSATPASWDTSTDFTATATITPDDGSPAHVLTFSYTDLGSAQTIYLVPGKYSVAVTTNRTTALWPAPAAQSITLPTAGSDALAFDLTEQTAGLTISSYPGASKSDPLDVELTCQSGTCSGSGTESASAVDTGEGVAWPDLPPGKWQAHITGTIKGTGGAKDVTVDKKQAVTLTAGATATADWN